MRRLMVLAAGIALSASARPAAAEVWNKSFNVSPHPTVRIVTDDGRVMVHTRTGGTVDAHVEYNAYRWGLVIGSRHARVELTQAGNVVTVSALEPRGVIAIGAFSERMVIEVTAPRECDVEVRSGDGSVEVEPIVGRLLASLGDGRLRVRGVRGNTMLSSGDGAIEASDLDGQLSAHTGDGRIVASGRFDGLDVRTNDGRVDVEARNGSKLGSGWNLESGDGPMSLRVPPDLAATLDLRSGDGRVNVDLPVTISGRFRDNEMRGTLNGGGPTLRIRTGDGTVTVTSDR